ncbi:polyphosphate kinase 1 [Thermomonas sp.]|uniref:polyphosphate kinase 1 n=1 Tax=Thermomonas sp. TaxID=1971895 RepID=UPI0026182F72|nr:polyphosphate kinase 1 [Thermomonas sp.]MCO5056197.1 polyphosphate kinase 1 [Thermomonas sp.]
MNTAVPAPSLDDPSLYANRELGQIDFNRRVLEQARDPTLPLLERLRYLCISCTNLDEFFEIRCGAVRQAAELGLPAGRDGLAPATLLDEIHSRAARLVEGQYHCFHDELKPALAAQGIHLPERHEWTPQQADWLRAHFQSDIMPVLSPLALDPAHPFPKILNKSLNVVVVLEGRDAFGREGHLAIVRAPRSLPRIIRLPELDPKAGQGESFVFLSSVLSAFAQDLFPGMRVLGAHQFRVTRNAELTVIEDAVDNLALALRDELAGRGYLRAERLEIDTACPDAVVALLLDNFGLTARALYRIHGPVNLSRVARVCRMVERPDLKFPPFQPRLPPGTDSLFERLREGDLLLHHPGDSFAPVLELVRQAADDPDVLAIKQTLYRTARESPIVEHLVRAARGGKDVTVVVELRARFDEEANLRLADRLQEAGVQVVYGVVGHKAHAKMLLIVRREDGALRRYVHLSTGNYHSDTARAYTDFGLLSADPDIGNDVHLIFQQLSGLAAPPRLARLLESPFTLHRGVLEKIRRETAHARHGRKGRILAKMNAINEPEVVRALYEASRAGVEIDLIVRGACALRPGIAGVSDTVRVRSIVGRFLEHHRIWWFGNDGAPELFCSSADWLERNLLRRIEIAFPILDPALARRVLQEGLLDYLADNRDAWLLGPDGRYEKCRADGDPPFSAQLARLEPLPR